MKALLCDAFGPIEDLTVREAPIPEPGDDEVLVDVRCASLNYPDALTVQGRYQIKPPLPFSPGMDMSGVVAKVGSNVTHVSVGDRVVAFPGHGAFAEACVAFKGKVSPLPESMPLDIGAACGLTYATVVHAFLDCTRLKPEETVLVLGASGGVGTAAIEVAKALGAKVIATASNDDKLTLCTKLGADLAINYNQEDLRKQALEMTNGKGVDVVLDPVGGEFSLAALRATGWGGRLLVVGFAAGEIPKIPLNYALLSERSIIGVFWESWAQSHPEVQQRNMKQLADWYVDGKINPLIDETVTLEQVSDAMKRFMARQVKGKVVVRVQDP